MQIQNTTIELCPERQKIILLDAAGFSDKLIHERIPLALRTYQRRKTELVNEFADFIGTKQMTMVTRKIMLWNVLPLIMENHKKEFRAVVEPMQLQPKVTTGIKDGQHYIYIHV